MTVALGRSRITVLSGPSGVGKGSVVDTVRRTHPEVWVSVSMTTRPPRSGEQDGVHYRFVSPERFAAARDAGEFLEHAVYAGHAYATPLRPVQEALARGLPVLLEIDLQGARQVRAADPAALLVFLAPPSLAELERRLAGRGTEDPERRQARLELAQAELAAEADFDVTVVNDDVGRAAERLVTLLTTAPTGER